MVTWLGTWHPCPCSYEGMGTALITCVAGCRCAPTIVDGTWQTRASLQQMHKFYVSHRERCAGDLCTPCAAALAATSGQGCKPCKAGRPAAGEPAATSACWSRDVETHAVKQGIACTPLQRSMRMRRLPSMSDAASGGAGGRINTIRNDEQQAAWQPADAPCRAASISHLPLVLPQVTQHERCRVRVTVRQEAGASPQAGHKVALMGLIVSHFPVRLTPKEEGVEAFLEDQAVAGRGLQGGPAAQQRGSEGTDGSSRSGRGGRAHGQQRGSANKD